MYYEIDKTKKIALSTTEQIVEINGSSFIYVADVESYISEGENSVGFLVPANTYFPQQIIADNFKVKGKTSGNAYIMILR